jgi:beta-galactosidase
MIEYWHWHTLPYGAETYWGGVLPHSLVPGRIYAEVSEIGAQLNQLGSSLDGFVPDADVAILWSNPSRYALQFMPPFALGDADDSYEHLVDAFYRGAIDAGRQVRILHVEQAREAGARELARRFPVLIAAGLYISTDDDLALLREYAEVGGHLVLGPRTAYADDEARARVEVAPAGLADAAGVTYEEFSNLEAPVGIESGPGSGIPAGAQGTLWADGLVATAAESIARFAHPRFGDFAAVTSNVHGEGRITVVGTVPDAALAASVVTTAVTTPLRWPFGEARSPLTVSSGTAQGARIWFVFNWGWERRTLVVSSTVTDAVSGAEISGGDELVLNAWDVRVLREEIEEARA